MRQSDPPPQGPQAIYEAWLARGEFRIQRARGSGQHLFYPRTTTPSGETDLEWITPSGLGRVYAITFNRGRESSYNIALIDLDEGVRMMSHVAGVTLVPIGTRVRARVEETENGPRVVFDPVPEEP